MGANSAHTVVTEPGQVVHADMSVTDGTRLELPEHSSMRFYFGTDPDHI